VTIRCETPTSGVTIALAGADAGGGRRLESGSGDHLDYALYLDPARTIPWSDAPGGTLGPLTVSGELSVPIYARIPHGQHVRGGAYHDGATAVVTY